MTKRTKRKWLFAGLMAFTGALGDLGTQLYGGHLVNVPRTVIAGVVVGAVARILGAVISAMVVEEEASDDTTEGGKTS